jgi:hypothetical protein
VRPTEYTFSASWETAAPRDAVAEVLLDLEHYVDWWPQVRAVASLGPDDALVVCRSVLPYDLELHLHAESRDPGLLRVGLDGPIRGFAAWRLTRTDGGTRLDFEQQVRAVRPAFVWASYAARPVLSWNHHRMMRGAQEGLRGLFGPASSRPAETGPRVSRGR